VAGEVACTGVHGANRLASNSLLEAVVFGLRAGRAIRADARRGNAGGRSAAPPSRAPLLVPDTTERAVRELTWEFCGIVRDSAGLQSAIETLDRAEWSKPAAPSLAAIELRNIHQVAALIATCALWREESRGAHYRTDFPEKRPEFARASRISRTHAASSTR
jgi:L-aspartate oxidase